MFPTERMVLGESRIAEVCDKCGGNLIETVVNNGSNRYPSFGWVMNTHCCIAALRARVEALEEMENTCD